MVAVITPPDLLTSPFSATLVDHVATLPHAFREQFLLSPEDPYAVLFEGHMDRVWRRYRWLWPIFWLLTRANLLFPETGHDVPATMTIVAGRDCCGLPCQRWNRTFAFATPRYFDATMGYDPERGQVVEWFGHTGWLEIAWDLAFHPPDTIEIVTRGASLRLGNRRLPLPRLLCPTVRAVERADLSHTNTIAIELQLTVPLLGAIFGYTGAFRLRHITRPDQERGDSDTRHALGT